MVCDDNRKGFYFILLGTGNVFSVCERFSEIFILLNNYLNCSWWHYQSFFTCKAWFLWFAGTLTAFFSFCWAMVLCNGMWGRTVTEIFNLWSNGLNGTNGKKGDMSLKLSGVFNSLAQDGFTDISVKIFFLCLLKYTDEFEM